MGRGSVRRTRTRPRRKPSAITSESSDLRSLSHEVHVLAGLMRKVASTLKVAQPSIVIRRYLQSDFEEELVRRFVAKNTWTTPQLAEAIGTYPKKILRGLHRLNRRTSKREDVEPFYFDNSSRHWRLQLEIADAKELVE